MQKLSDGLGGSNPEDTNSVNLWERIHRERHWGTCPEPAMARFMMRRFGASPSMPRPKVLDLGCGAGAQTLWLAMNHFIIDAVDASSSAVERAERFVTRWAPYSGARFQIADARSLPLDDGAFDAVIDACTLQHVLDDQEKAVAEAFRVLKPGGWLFSMMAALDHSITAFGDMTARAHSSGEVTGLFGKYSEQVFVEKYQHTDRGLTIAHWAIEAQKLAIYGEIDKIDYQK